MLFAEIEKVQNGVVSSSSREMSRTWRESAVPGDAATHATAGLFSEPVVVGVDVLSAAAAECPRGRWGAGGDAGGVLCPSTLPQLPATFAVVPAHSPVRCAGVRSTAGGRAGAGPGVLRQT